MSPVVNPPVPPRSAWRRLAQRSARLLCETQHELGAWPASPTFEQYGFSWFRDGSFIAEGASAAGLHAEASRFYRWCAAVLEREGPAVAHAVARLTAGQELADDEYLPARYNLDGSRHEDGWWNFQVDGYGTWLWALERHLARTGEAAQPLAPAVDLAVDYLVATGRRTCRDWWEENRDQVHVATLAGVAAGLRAASRMGTLDSPRVRQAHRVADGAVEDILRDGVHDGHLVKWLGGVEVDASLLAVAALYDVLPVDDPRTTRTVREIEDVLVDRGVHRYRADTFYGGGQWPVLACLLGWHHLRAGAPERTAELLDWVVATADRDGLLPEQVPPMLAPEALEEWLARWGPSAHPLVWSHGMFLAVLAEADPEALRPGGARPA